MAMRKRMSILQINAKSSSSNFGMVICGQNKILGRKRESHNRFAGLS